MILILSTPYDDDTNIVLEHLSIMNQKYFRINDVDLFNGNTKMYHDVSSEPKLIVENEFFGKIDLSDIKCVWYRKFGFFDTFKKNIKEGESNLAMFEYLKSEYTSVLDLFFNYLKDKKWLNNYQSVKKQNKINSLICCNKIGLPIPKTIISNRNETLDMNEKFITKSIKDGYVISAKEKRFFLMTVEIIPEILSHNQIFFPSLFQEKIEKEYELRIFHLNGKNYPMAIFSQNDKQTKVDFRHYNYNKPNRVVPYYLPTEIDKKISKLMKILELNTGSIDMIKGTDGNYYFLEVNPSGQFRMTSLPCNYNLHYEVAKFLKKLNT